MFLSQVTQESILIFYRKSTLKQIIKLWNEKKNHFFPMESKKTNMEQHFLTLVQSVSHLSSFAITILDN